MDKNNDIKTSYVSKWEAAPKNMGTLFTYIDLVIGMACSLPSEIRDNLHDLMDKTFDEYNKLEAAYEEACDNIYQHDEENRELREHYEEELRIREKEKDEKDKLIDELNFKIEELKLRMSVMHGCYGLNPLGELNRKIKELEKENKELKDALNVDRELGKYVGKCVADSMQEGWKNGRYELHPYTRFDIHVEETKNTSMSSNRYSIPNVVVALHNTQTEMERDTAQHECEELNEKVDRLWRVNDELNRKIKEFKKENKELKATLAVCAVDANTAKKLCNGIVSKVKRTRNNEEEK